MGDNMDINVLALAYLGDSIYECSIRKFLLEQNILKVKDLQKASIQYVSAKSQAKFLKEMIEKDFFKEEELSLLKRARNHKSRTSKNTDIITYKHSTALEALIGDLYLKKEFNRIEEIMNFIKEFNL